MKRKSRNEKPSHGKAAPEPEEDPDKDTRSRFANRMRENDADARITRALRRQRIRKIKEDIRNGVYESDEKLTIAIDRLIEDVLRQVKP